jgi:hypothetical protein
MGYDDATSVPHRSENEGEAVKKRNGVHPSISCSTCHR